MSSLLIEKGSDLDGRCLLIQTSLSLLCLSCYINPGITAKVFVGIVTFKIFLPGVHMAFFFFPVTFNVVLMSGIRHFITSSA
jgi:hypothetical protein